MNKIVTVTNKSLALKLKEKEVTLLYPLSSYCTGYEEYFDINEVDDFCLVNRILNDDDLDNLEKILKNSNIKGIVFDDLGLIQIIKDMPIVKILLLDHIACSTSSINYYLDYVDSVVVSNDLTKKEIQNITLNAKKKVVINVFGLKTLMYSRRTLVSNYEIYHDLPFKNVINASIDSKKFKIIENKFGTKFYAYPYYNALELLDLSNVLYFWYDPILLDDDKIMDIVFNNNIKNIETDEIFLNKKTVYKVGDLDA